MPVLDVINKYPPDEVLIPFITDYDFVCRKDNYNHIRGKHVEDIEDSCNFNQIVYIEYIIDDRIKLHAMIKDGNYEKPIDALIWICNIPLTYRDYYKGKLIFNNNTGKLTNTELVKFFKERNIEKLIKKI